MRDSTISTYFGPVIILAIFLYFSISVFFSPVIAETTTASTTAALEDATTTPVLPPEPLIRVGVYKTPDDVQFTSPAPHDVYAGDVYQGVLLNNQMAILGYHDGLYTFVSDNLNLTTDQPIRIIPGTPENHFVLPNITRKLSGRKSNYNAYRGTLEYRYSPISKMPYLINELPLEAYTAGIAETSDGAPIEYLKALQTAARTYAYTAIAPVSSKHLFDVFATTQDQLYLGYNSEIEMPRTASSTAATAGLVVAYNDTPVTTYYFSRSSGKTKTAKPAKPWLVSVVAKYDKGLKPLGHGVGMSNHDALLRAKKDKWTYDQILGYYYTSTTLKLVY